jgi:hypothetical protein
MWPGNLRDALCDIRASAFRFLSARTLARHPAAIEDVNGREVGLDLAREWTR